MDPIKPVAERRNARIDCGGYGFDSSARPCGEFNCDFCHPAPVAEPAKGQNGEYHTIVADPPWMPTLGSTWKSSFNDKARPHRQYPTMTLDEIKALNVPAAKQSHLYLWCLAQHVDWGYEVARAWGFEPIILWTWKKPGLGTGRFRCNTEYVLVCRKGTRHGNPFGFGGRSAQATNGTLFEWPRDKHSKKPDEFYALVESLSCGPYLEMFAREKRNGWSSWGNEIESDVCIAAQVVAEPAAKLCGWMREGCDLQCKLDAGHGGMHVWESEGEMLSRTFTDGENVTGDAEGVQEMPQVSRNSGCEVSTEAAVVAEPAKGVQPLPSHQPKTLQEDEAERRANPPQPEMPKTFTCEDTVSGRHFCHYCNKTVPNPPQPETEQWKACPVDCMLKRDAENYIAAKLNPPQPEMVQCPDCERMFAKGWENAKRIIAEHDNAAPACCKGVQTIKCPVCGGSGSVDSGGVLPWGEGIFVKCGDCNGIGTVEIADGRWRKIAPKQPSPEQGEQEGTFDAWWEHYSKHGNMITLKAVAHAAWQAAQSAEPKHLSVVELCLKHSNLSEYITQVEGELTQLKAAQSATVQNVLPCGHSWRYGFTYEDGMSGFCTLCELEETRKALEIYIAAKEPEFAREMAMTLAMKAAQAATVDSRDVDWNAAIEAAAKVAAKRIKIPISIDENEAGRNIAKNIRALKRTAPKTDGGGE